MHDPEKLAAALADAQVDLNPHQLDAAFADGALLLCLEDAVTGALIYAVIEKILSSYYILRNPNSYVKTPV